MLRPWLFVLLAACRWHFDPLADDGVGGDALGNDQVELTIIGAGAVTGPGVACVDHCIVSAPGGIALTAVAAEGWELGQFSAPCGTSATCTAPPRSQITATFVRSPLTANLVFVSSTPIAAASGVAAFDTMCKSLAGTAGYPGTFVAFVSTAGTDARTRLGTGRGWVRVDGLPFLDQPTDLGAGSLPRSVLLDETGAAVQGFVMTGSDQLGRASANRCSDWIATTGAADGAYSHWAGRAVTGGFNASCAAGPYPVLCFGIDRVVPVTLRPPPFPVGRYAFVSPQFLVGGGIAAADAQCQADATAAGLPGLYHALLATSTESITDRAGGSLAGWWRRPDGLVITRTGLDRPPFDAALDVEATGNATAVPAAYFGANTSVEIGTLAGTCDDWTTTAPSTTRVTIEDLYLFDHPAAPSPCSFGFALLCGQLP